MLIEHILTRLLEAAKFFLTKVIDKLRFLTETSITIERSLVCDIAILPSETYTTERSI